MSKKKLFYTFEEEVANAISHGIAAFSVLVGMPFIYIQTYLHGRWIDVVGVTIFCIAIFLMFLMSTLYHSTAFNSKHRIISQKLDHIFIYVAIAGSYTPVAITLIGGWQGVLILVIQWAMVIFGALNKSLSRRSIPKLSVAIYLIMGWSAVLFMPTLITKARPILLSLIVIGGLFYTIGAFFYSKTTFKYQHFVWHLFVYLGALTHFIAYSLFLF